MLNASLNLLSDCEPHPDPDSGAHHGPHYFPSHQKVWPWFQVWWYERWISAVRVTMIHWCWCKCCTVWICFTLQPVEEDDGRHVVRCHGVCLCSFSPDWDRRECVMCESDSSVHVLELHNLMLLFSSENIAQFPIILWEPAKGGEHVQQFTERDHLTQTHSSDRLIGGTTHTSYTHTHMRPAASRNRESCFTVVFLQGSAGYVTLDHQDITVSLNTSPVITKALGLIKGGRQTLIIPADPSIMYLVSVKQANLLQFQWSKTHVFSEEKWWLLMLKSPQPF